MSTFTKSVVAVTGANGYVGTLITEACRSEMNTVRLIRTPNHESDVRWSFTDQRQIEESLKAHNVDVLIHAAWHMTSSSAKVMQDVCIRGSQNLFEAAQRAGVKRLIFISSISAFEGCRSVYGQSKLAVEKIARRQGAVILRLGLVYGRESGGVFGGIRRQIRTKHLIPVINFGSEPQYLLHEKTLREVIQRAVNGAFDDLHEQPLTIAHPQYVTFRDLILKIAEQEHRTVKLLPIPWHFLYGALYLGESIGMKMSFRSDSVRSFVHYNRNPDFAVMQRYNISPLAFSEDSCGLPESQIP